MHCKKHVQYRVAKHSGNSGKLREFSSWRKSQGNSGNFDLLLKLRETQEYFDLSNKFREIFRFLKFKKIFSLI